MSDSDDTDPRQKPIAELFREIEDRPEEEIRELEREFQQSFRGSGGVNYVAPPAPGYDVHGIWHVFGSHNRSGYATHALALHWMLAKELRIPTAHVPHRSIDIDIEKFPDDRYELLFEWTKEAVGIPHILFSSFPLEVSSDMHGTTATLVPYCAFEGHRIGKYARDLCDKPIFAAIWVVSDFVKRAFVEAGVPAERVHTVRPMLTEGPFSMTPIELLATRKNRPVTHEDPFTFGFVGTWQRRKGVHDLLRAYFGAFRREEPVVLRIKTSALFDAHLTLRKLRDKLVAEIAEVAREFGDNDFPASRRMPKITLDLGTELTDKQLIEYIGDFDAFANPSYGEGLGIPHTWAKAQGVPMITTGYGAIGDLLHELASHTRSTQDSVIDWKLAPVDPEVLRATLMFDRDTCWGTYDPAAFGQAMRQQFVEGRRFDVGAARTTRSLFGRNGCVGEVKHGLKTLLPERWAKEWDL